MLNIVSKKGKFINKRFLFILIISSGIVPFMLVNLCASNTNNSVPVQKQQEVNATQPKEPPIIIWFHNGVTDTTEALNTALSSGMISHVIVKYMHRADADWRKKKSVIEAIEIVKKSPAKLIWSRNLWPYRNQKDIQIEDFFDPNYYIREIQSIRSEAREMGADSIALDIEAYADSIMKQYLTGMYKINAVQRDELRGVVKEVVQAVGQVEFLYPGGHLRSAQGFNILARLGKNRIAEATFYSDEERLKRVKFEYEIFGAYLNVVRENKRHSHLPYHLVPEIFEKSERWSGKKGLFLYPKEHKALEIAKELLAYSKSLPLKKNDPNDINLNK